MRRIVLLVAALASACATPTIQSTRAHGPARIVIAGTSFDALVGCIGEAITQQYQMTYTPSATGGSFYYAAGQSVDGRAMILVDVHRGPPPRAEVRVTGGPWLGVDNRITRAVQGCDGR